MALRVRAVIIPPEKPTQSTVYQRRDSAVSVLILSHQLHGFIFFKESMRGVEVLPPDDDLLAIFRFNVANPVYRRSTYFDQSETQPQERNTFSMPLRRIGCGPGVFSHLVLNDSKVGHPAESGLAGRGTNKQSRGARGRVNEITGLRVR